MKAFDVSVNVDKSGEYVLGSQETGSHACYLIYGVLKPGEKGREWRPGHGHEEIAMAVAGDISCTGQFNGVLKEGQAVHLRGDEKLIIENRSTKDAVYVISGGHSEQGHPHEQE